MVLLNLGAPESVEDIPRFVYRLLSDPQMVELPWPARNILAFGISRLRARAVAERYAAIGGKSPLDFQTRQQVDALQKMFDSESILVRHSFRHSPPYADQVIAELASKGVKRIVAIPLYPQHSRTTTESSFSDFRSAADKYEVRVAEVRSYPTAPGFLEAVSLITEKSISPGDHLLYCAHGLPMKTIRRGDQYLNEIRQTYNALIARLPAKVSHSLAFQSNVGPFEWTRPYLPDELASLSREGKRSIVVVPLSFVSENLETLWELDIEHAHIAKAQGIEKYARIPTVMSHPSFIGELARLARDAIAGAGWQA